MANTEGMSDDEAMLMERLLSVDGGGSITQQNKSALERRMELPMGERPAARVIRSSHRTTRTCTRVSQKREKSLRVVSHEKEPIATRVADRSSSSSSSTTSAVAATLSSPSSPAGIMIMGDVMERKSSSRRRKQKQQQQQQQAKSKNDTTRTATSATTSRFAKTASKSGFPSIHVPLGQLVNPRTKSQKKMIEAGDSPLTKQTNKNKSKLASSTYTSAIVDDDDNNDRNDDKKNETAVTSIQRQAQAMLEQMSPDEIKEHVQELQAALSPETIAFLKQRGRQKQKQQLCKVPHVSQEQPFVKKKDSPNNNDTSSDTEKSKSSSKNPDNPVEKQRLAQVLSSIRTYEDMDNAYNQEVKERFEFLGLTSSNDNDNNNNNKNADNDQFHMACDLLRSSVPRQNLWAARTVSQRLQQDVLQFGSDYRCSYALGNDRAQTWPYPVLLPVSLRCLLDASISKVNGSVLHTYVLQALYALLRLRSSRDHVHGIVDGGNNNEAAILYQEYFLDDAIPTPPLQTCYSSTPIQRLNHDDNNYNNNNPAVAYATASSSTSAQQDGQAFVQDPLWTLLSRMRILPRLAQLLMEEHLTVEAVVAVCGILTLVAQRTPGAATAIVQHPTLLRDLTNRALVHQNEESPALATLFLGCTLARQSRIAAQGLDTIFLPHVLCILAPSTSLERQQKRSLQKWAVVLWRTRLRYGLSLADLPNILTLAAPHCALGVDQQEWQNQLAPYFFSTFTCILNCIRAMKIIHTRSQNERDVALNSDDRSILSQAGIWLSSSKRQALQHFVNASSMIEAKPSAEKDLSWLQHLTSILHYLDRWLILSLSDAGEEIGEFKTEEITEMEEYKCLMAILSIFEAGSVKKLFQVALQRCFWAELSELPAADGAALAYEAASCAFVDALLALATSISTSHTSDENPIFLNTVREKVLECLQSRLSDGPIDNCNSPKRPCSVEMSRRYWLNRTHASLVRFLATTEPGPMNPITHVVGLCVIGRLEKGEESLAALLFSCDSLFQQLRPGEHCGHISPIATLFVRELCLTEHARIQLDHSFKLRNALGLTSDKMGPFDTQSLRSEADGIPSSSIKNFLLPMGSLWLWKIFGGIVVNRELSKEVGQVLLTALELVYELETTDEFAEQVYVQSLDVGGRLYFLMNICFQPFLGQERIIFLVNNLIDRYAKNIDSTSALGFAKECELHSSSSKEKGQNDDSEERQVEQLLDPSVPSTDKVLKQKQIRSVESFIGDLCDAFLDYGVQYPFFTKCLRSFLCSGFPSMVRCKLIERLREVPHLLTLPEEKDLTSSLLVCLNGGLPSVDKSIKDTPEILDACASLFTKGKRIRSDAFFVLSWVTAMLARSLAIHLEEVGEGGLAVSKRRISSLEPSFAHGVLLATEGFLASNGTKHDLVDISARCCRESGDRVALFSDGYNWDQALFRLKKASTDA